MTTLRSPGSHQSLGLNCLHGLKLYKFLLELPFRKVGHPKDIMQMIGDNSSHRPIEKIKFAQCFRQPFHGMSVLMRGVFFVYFAKLEADILEEGL